MEMMFPARTSLIPVQIALARFLQEAGWSVLFANYPYWYLGTTPYRYLTGPILPGLLWLGQALWPALGLFDLFWLVLLLAWLAGALGLWLLVKKLAGMSQKSKKVVQPKRLAWLSALFYFLGPLVFWQLPFSNSLALISFSFVVLVLFFQLKFLNQPSQKNKLTVIFSTGLIMLLDTKVLPSLVLGMIIILLATTDWQKIEDKLKKTGLVLGWALIIASFWYTPFYWLRLLLAPSFAGRPLLKIIGQLAQLLPIGLALTLAVISAKKFKKKNPLFKFAFYWLFVFSFLSLIRFIADPDFWLDWTAYLKELQLGLSLALAVLTSAGFDKLNLNKPAGFKPRPFLIGLGLTAGWCLSSVFVFKTKTWPSFQASLKNSYEYQLSRALASQVEPGQTVFLSGSPVFWLNAFFDVRQVRGGVDRASSHPFWREAVWEIREGRQPEKASQALSKLGVDWLVVHGKNSREIYHDFKHLEKFDQLDNLVKVYDKNGDRIYRVKR